MTVLSSQRHLFDIPPDIAYFNCAYNTPQLNETTRRLASGINVKKHPWEIMPADYFTDAETVRRLASEVLGGSADGYAVIPAASYGLSTAARAIEPQLQAGDGILVMEEEFPSNVLPWRRIAQEKGVQIVTVPVPDDGDWTRAILERIDRRIKVASLSPCHWTNGAFINLATVRRACNASGTILVADATQALGAMPFSIEEVQPDFLVAAGYKWLLSPYGFGLMYVAEQWRDARPLEESWQARENAADFTSLVRYSDNYMPGARRFDVGETCRPTILPGVIAALEQLRSWTVPSVAASLTVINEKIASHLEMLGFQLPPAAQRCPHMFGAAIPAHYKGRLVTELRDRNIFVSQRGSAVRFAPHLFINADDIARLLEALDDLVRGA
ncbi:aminotransferase class V-fold PLP-dependent enzyme [uncultured Chitinophaga sp.]|jgi:Selenocysteine lyase|uniref:aminotransferase class V-fold PLP-dependent enzyme n=1 Tax=uncultured Chitinophaga sp. TaxID=339340 RepID=UPI00262D1F16|nr:aminotransferase class V-fold PLP-dependent enzyme [uncultured Chitinophaga sp.]